MMVGGLKTVTVKPGHEKEFEKLFAELHAKIREAEAGCMFYSLMKSRTNPLAYIVEEQYRDEAAWQAHQSSEYGKVYFPKMRAIIDITVEYFDVIVAYSSPSSTNSACNSSGIAAPRARVRSRGASLGLK